MPHMMTTGEVADYLRIKERKVYELVKRQAIPCSRVAGKWLFPQDLIDLWVLQGIQGTAPAPDAPPIVAGSHDLLLDWAIKESACNLAMLACGSTGGLSRLVDGNAMVASMHLRDEVAGGYNVPAVKHSGLSDVVVLAWAGRRQGIVTAPGNPLGIAGVEDLKSTDTRVIERQDGAGSFHLFRQLLADKGVQVESLSRVPGVAKDEADLALAIRDGKADAGLAIEAVARQYRLDFIPLVEERYDLVMRRRDYFSRPVQDLMALSRLPKFRDRAAELGGYDVSETGTVMYNSP